MIFQSSPHILRQNPRLKKTISIENQSSLGRSTILGFGCECFLFFAHSWASLVAVPWGAYKTHFPTVSKKASIVSRKAEAVSKKATAASNKAPKHNCK